MSTPELLAHLVEYGYERKWYLDYAKFNKRYHQSLLSHSLNVGLLSVNLAELIIQGLKDDGETVEIRKEWSNDLPDLVLIAGFMHDCGKSGEEYQEATAAHIRGQGAPSTKFAHEQPSVVTRNLKDLQTFLEKKGYRRDDEFWENIAYCVSTLGEFDNVGSTALFLLRRPSLVSKFAGDVVHSADVLLSLTLDELATNRKIFSGDYTRGLEVEFTRVSVIRGVTTQILLLSLEELLSGMGLKPLAWHQNGTVFCYKDTTQAINLDTDALKRKIVEKLKEIVFSDADKLARASFGDINKQIITEPNFLFYSGDVIDRFWRHRFSEFKRRLVGSKRNYSEELSEDERKKLAEEFGLRDDELEQRLKRFIEVDFAAFNVLMGIKKQVVDYTNNPSEAEKIIEQCVYKKLGINAQVVGEPHRNMEKKKRLNFAKQIWRNQNYIDTQKWEKELMDALVEATKELGGLFKGKRNPDVFLEAIASLLVNDVTRPVLVDANGMVEQIYEKYLEGKGRGTPLCVICNAPAEVTAQAELFGDSEIFHDFLRAGSRINATGNKLMVCRLCDFEFKVRRLLFEFEGGSTLAVVPHIAVSAKSRLYWKAMADNLVIDDYSPARLDDIEFLKEVVYDQDKFRKDIQRVWSSQAQMSFDSDIGRLLDDNRIRDALEELCSRYGDLSPLVENPGANTDFSDIDGFIRSLREGCLKLSEKGRGDILTQMGKIKPIYYTGNYLLLFTQPPKEKREAVRKLKWSLYQMILAKLFLGAVFEITRAVLFEENKKGYVKFPTDALFKEYSKRLFVEEGWIPIRRLDFSLKKLASIMLVGSILSKADADYGGDTLLRLPLEEPGKVVVRYEQKVSKVSKNKYLLDLIRALELWGKIEEDKY